jgi:hypothetical protein
MGGLVLELPSGNFDFNTRTTLFGHNGLWCYPGAIFHLFVLGIEVK